MSGSNQTRSTDVFHTSALELKITTVPIFIQQINYPSYVYKNFTA